MVEARAPVPAAAVEAARRVRRLVARGDDVADRVAEILAAIRDGGDAALLDHVAALDRGPGENVEPLVTPESELDDALGALPERLRAALELAIANVRSVAEATVHPDRDVVLPQGQTIRVREVPVRRAAVYVPGGRAAYPSSVVMGVVAARTAGVEHVVVATPSDDPVLRAACRLAGADRVLRMGGAHAIAALAHGTATVDAVDVIVGPGNLWAQEAKRQVAGLVGIDGFAGPSDLLVLADRGADPELVALDLAAQAEHGAGSLVVLVSDCGPLAVDVLERLGRIAAAHRMDLAAPDPTSIADIRLEEGVALALPAGPPRPGAATAATVLVDGPRTGLAVAEAFAPEHLELVGATVEPLAGGVRSAGCVLVGSSGATAFGDYVAGSNHTLPTEGAARFGSALGARTFRRTMYEVRLGSAAAELAPAGAAIAEAEGFAVHAISMRARQNEESR